MQNFNFNDIEAYLRNGGDPETIANAFADKLNLALATIEDESALDDAAKSVVNAWNNFADVFFGINKLPKNSKITDWKLASADDVIGIMDALIQIIPVINHYAELVEGLENNVKNTKEKVTDSDIWKTFFNLIN